MLSRHFIILLAVMAVMLAAVPSAQAITSENIAVSKVESTEAVLVVKTDVTSDITVEYGHSPGSYTTTKNCGGMARHEIIMDGLTPSALVYYQVTMTETGNPANTATLAEKSFRSQRAAGEAFSYAVTGDNRPNSDTVVQPAVFGTIITQMLGEGLDLNLSVGDIIFGLTSDTVARSVERYDGFFDVTAPLTASVPLYVALGNHERVHAANSKTAYEQEFVLPENNGADAGTNGEHYYSFDNGDTHFVALSTEIPGQEGYITGNQMAWLEADLAATDRVWKVVFMHKPLFSGLHAGDPWVDLSNTAGQLNKAEVHAVFLEYDVDVVFQGHEHFYLHHLEDGIHYIISGGGGAPLSVPPMADPGDVYGASTYQHVKVDETTTTMDITAIDSTGVTLESFTILSLDLGIAHASTYWDSFVDYSTRTLTVDYTLSNDDVVDLSNIQVVDLEASNDVLPATSTPFAVADLNSGDSTTVTVSYSVPPGVSSFNAVNYVTCDDGDGNSYEFPGPAP